MRWLRWNLTSSGIEKSFSLRPLLLLASSNDYLDGFKISMAPSDLFLNMLVLKNVAWVFRMDDGSLIRGDGL